MPEKHGIIPGLIEATPAGDSADNYTRIHKKEPKAEEGEKGDQSDATTEQK